VLEIGAGTGIVTRVPFTLDLLALRACRAAADKFSDDELGSYETGARDQARHRWQRRFGRCAARKHEP
jgi:hypothetical protein